MTIEDHHAATVSSTLASCLRGGAGLVQQGLVEAGRGNVPLIKLRWRRANCFANSRCTVSRRDAPGGTSFRRTVGTVAVAQCARPALPLRDYRFELSQYLWIGHGARKLTHPRRFGAKLPRSCHVMPPIPGSAGFGVGVRLSFGLLRIGQFAPNRGHIVHAHSDIV